MLRRVRTVCYDAATVDGDTLVAHYSTDTGIRMRISSPMVGPGRPTGVDPGPYASVWGLANFGRVFVSLLPVDLEVRALSLEPPAQDAWHRWFLGTLTETFYRAGLDPVLDLVFSGPRLEPRTADTSLEERAILMSGGGKDSAVAGELLKDLGVPFTWYAFGAATSRRASPARGIARLAGGQPLATASARVEVARPGAARYRTASPERLRRVHRWHGRRYRERGWFSLTGQIVQACLVAENTRSRYVIIGNERSANEGNGIRVGDHEVNHQYIKSYPFEREFAQFVRRYLHPELVFASLLMPFYEIQVGEMFARHPAYLDVVKSCNHRTLDRPWCMACPKCAFVFLLLSAFFDRERVVATIGKDLLAEPSLLETFRSLCGAGPHKPLECVGSVDESRLALFLAAQRRTVPDGLADLVPGEQTATDLRRRFFDAFDEETGVPAAWNEGLKRALTGEGVDGERQARPLR